MVWSNYFVADNAFEIYKNIFDMLDVWDGHTHVGKDIDGNKLSANQLIKIMDRSHVDRAVSINQIKLYIMPIKDIQKD